MAFEVSDGVGDSRAVRILTCATSRRADLNRIDRADGPNGASANGGSFEPTISDDGRRVAFLDRGRTTSATVTRTARWTRTCAASASARRCWRRWPTARPRKGRTPARAPRRSAAVACGVAFDQRGDKPERRRLGSEPGRARARPAERSHAAGQRPPEQAEGDGTLRTPRSAATGNRVSFLSDADFGSTPPGRKLYVRDLIRHGDARGRARTARAARRWPTRATNAPVLSADGNARGVRGAARGSASLPARSPTARIEATSGTSRRARRGSRRRRPAANGAPYRGPVLSSSTA